MIDPNDDGDRPADRAYAHAGHLQRRGHRQAAARAYADAARLYRQAGDTEMADQAAEASEAVGERGVL